MSVSITFGKHNKKELKRKKDSTHTMYTMLLLLPVLVKEETAAANQNLAVEFQSLSGFDDFGPFKYCLFQLLFLKKYFVSISGPSIGKSCHRHG